MLGMHRIEILFGIIGLTITRGFSHITKTKLASTTLLTRFSQLNNKIDKRLCLIRQGIDCFGCKPTNIPNIASIYHSEMEHLCLIFLSFFTFYAGLQEEELQTAHLMSFTWTSHIAASVLTGH